MRYWDPQKVTSPKSFVKKVKVIFDGGETSYSLAEVTWEDQETPSIGIRWNVARREWDDLNKLNGNKIAVGMPTSRGWPVWFILPDDIFLNENEGNRRLKGIFTLRHRSKQLTDVLEMLVAPSNGANKSKVTALSHIRDFTKGASELTIIDPYLVGGKNVDTSTYLDDFKNTIRLEGGLLKKLHLIFDGGNITKSVKTGLKQIVSKAGCSLVMHETDKIHDRIWIKDKREAIIIGTSFGGIGNKLSLLLPLPDEDLKALLQFLQSSGMFTTNNSL